MDDLQRAINRNDYTDIVVALRMIEPDEDQIDRIRRMIRQGENHDFPINVRKQLLVLSIYINDLDGF